MTTEVVWTLIGWISLPMLAALAGVLVWRRVFKQFPVFFSYVVLSAFVVILRLLAYQGTKTTYFNVYWISELVLTLFAFLATYELFAKRLFPRFYAVRFYRRLFPIAAVLFTAMAVLTVFASPHNWILFIKAIHGFYFFRVIVLFLFIVLMLIMGRRWSRYEFGIAFGLAVDAAVFLTSFALRTRPVLVRRSLNQLPVIAYDIACVIWLVTFMKPDNAKPTGKSVDPAVLNEARKWEEDLKETLAGKKPHG